ncbi:MAG TPA: DPP IV N-terminal domain-containing protein [Vicinamibacterales bacterium]
MNTRWAPLAVAVTLAALCSPLHAQDRIKSMPGYEQYEKMLHEIPDAVTLGALAVRWADDATSFEYSRDGKRYRYDIGRRQPSEIGDASEDAPFARGGQARTGGQSGRGRGEAAGPARGRQYDNAASPDGVYKAFYMDRNVWIARADGSDAIAVTSDGSEASRVKYGTASWVYGEELDQRTAMWWSPDSRKLAFYRFDETQVPDFFLQMHQTDIQDTLDVEAYPKPGKPNPIVGVFVYDVAAKKTLTLDVRDGRPFENAAVGYYVYNVAWSPDGRAILLDRTNRKQDVLEFAACDPDSGACRAVVHDAWPTGWVDNRPETRFLNDGRRFIWESSRNGWRNFYLYDLSGRLLTPLTASTTYEADAIARVDEADNTLFYTARDGDNFMKVQLHRVGLDGRHDVRLTDPAFMHTVSVSPDGRYFVDVAQTHDTPPSTRLLDTRGKVVAQLASSDTSHFDQLGLKKVEMFTYMAADGKTPLHGLIDFPSTFDPSKKYPVLVSVYGGPAAASNTATERFTVPNPLTEYGFLIVNLDSRAVPGMGRRTLDAIYEKLGQVEIDDMAAGVKSLWSRPYVDRARVGIFGASYGGYSSVMELLRHPDVFAAASASSPPTDWRNYDTVYTERYMWLPSENKAGYDAGSAMNYATVLRGRLLIYYGTSDNNVHPSNSLQLIRALQQAGKSFDVQVGPDQGHSAVNQQRMMEFFIDNLVLHPSEGDAAVQPETIRR